MTYFWNYGTPFVSLERLKLETRNLACRWTPRETNGKMKNRAIWVTRGSRDPISEFWDPLHISGMVEASNSKFGMQMDPEGS